MRGLGEIILGLILILIFYITLTADSIPIIWTGALLVGIVSILRGLYHSVTSPRSQPTASVSPQIPPPSQLTPPSDVPPPPPHSRTCSSCGFRNQEGVPTCIRCGSQL